MDLYEGDTHHALTIARGPDGHRIEGLGDPATARLRCASAAESRITGDIDGQPTLAVVFATPAQVEVRLNGRTHTLALTRPRAATVAGPADGRIMAPMPGRVLAVGVKPGARVEAGERLLVLEAMKMEHRITAPAAATVRALHVAEGDQVSEGAMLVELELTT